MQGGIQQKKSEQTNLYNVTTFNVSEGVSGALTMLVKQYTEESYQTWSMAISFSFISPYSISYKTNEDKIFTH